MVKKKIIFYGGQDEFAKVWQRQRTFGRKALLFFSFGYPKYTIYCIVDFLYSGCYSRAGSLQYIANACLIN